MKNIIERACLIAQNDVLIKEDLGLNQKPRDMEKIELDSFKDNTLHIPDQGMNIGKLLKNIEKKYMEHALKLTRGNESKAARLLEMNHHTFRYKWKKLILGKLSKK